MIWIINNIKNSKIDRMYFLNIFLYINFEVKIDSITQIANISYLVLLLYF